MRYPSAAELPPEQAEAERRAKRLERFTIAYLVTAVTVVGLALGSSQAMKAAWIEDLLSFIPPIAFLWASRRRHQAPTAGHPWGRHRSVSGAYLASSVALLALGLYVLVDSVMKLALAERPPVGLVEVFGVELWSGWLMLAALAYTGIPPVVLGRMKEPLAATLHDKVLHADAEMNRADWKTAGAAAVGVIGIGLGFWWADAVAGTLIALDVIRDGWKYVRASVDELEDRRPRTVDEAEDHPLQRRLEEHLAGVGWVAQAVVRLREAGHVLVGEVWVVPGPDVEDLPGCVEATVVELRDLDWKLHEVALMPVRSIEGVPDGIRVVRGPADRAATPGRA